MSTVDADKPTPHPAKYTAAVLDAIRLVLDEHLPSAGGPAAPSILDPFAGVGGIHELGDFYRTYAVEIEPEWAAQSEARGPTWCGDFFEFDPVRSHVVEPHSWPLKFDAIITSPTYGNRMADKHDARDASKRITYKHKLGRDLSENNSGRMQWGVEYKLFHGLAWKRCRDRLLVDYGLQIVNVKDHVRRGAIVPVVDWHRERLKRLGFTMVDDVYVETPGMRFGQNHAARVDGEHVLVFVR